MEPTYRNGEFNFCFRLSYIFAKPERHDVVIIRLAGEKIMLLKRVVALEGEIVEFRRGKLFINGIKINEPYVRYPSNWNLPPRRVEQNHVYVLGDNRNVPINIHQFGQTSVDRIIGEPLWKK
jgi:signal peptidase I